MKKNIKYFLTRIILPGLIVLFFLSACFMFLNRHARTDAEKRKNHELLLNEYHKSAPPRAENGQTKEQPADEPGMAAFHDFLMTFDPSTGTAPRERLVAALEKTRALASLKQSSQIIWQGYPSDLGGRTRAVMYDPNDATH